MSNTTQGVDARAYLAGWLQAVTGMTIADINAIPDEKWTEGHGGCTRPANALISDTVTMLKWTTAAAQGEESSAITSASDEALNAVVNAPWGMPTPVFILAQIAVSHIWYHDGQLNYIQSLLGDGEVHWMV